MGKTYVFAGASSKVAVATAEMLQANNQKVIGISTKEQRHAYNEFYRVDDYRFGQFPSIQQAIDGLVYFPGSIVLKPFARLTEADFLSDFQRNTLGAAAFVQAYLTELKKSPAASIVFVSSVAAQTGMPFHGSIATAKAGLEGLNKALAAEFAPSIRVNTVAPSLSNTPLAEKLLNTPDKLEASHKRHPLKRIGEADDLAHAINFLLTEKSAWMTGHVLQVDGGMSNVRLM